MSNKPITGEDVAALLHGIHTHAGIIKERLDKLGSAEYSYETEQAHGQIYYAEEDLLPVLEALGLPAPVWKKSLSVEEWKKQRK